MVNNEMLQYAMAGDASALSGGWISSPLQGPGWSESFYRGPREGREDPADEKNGHESLWDQFLEGVDRLVHRMTGHLTGRSGQDSHEEWNHGWNAALFQAQENLCNAR